MNMLKNQSKFPIRRSSSLSERICQELERQIREGVFAPGERLPAESDFSKSLGVSRNSYREALSLLEKSALVVRRQGIGTFVTESRPVIEGGIESLTGVVHMISSQGLKADSRIVAFRRERSDRVVEEKLELDPKTPVVYLETLKSAENWPVAVCVDIIAEKYLEGAVDPEKLNESIFEGLQEHHDINIRFAECAIIPLAASAELADRLKVVEGSPVLLLSQIHFDEKDRKVLFSKSYFPFDRFTFRLIRRR